MPNKGKKSDLATLIMRWIARVISTLVMVFIILMVIGSVFTGKEYRRAPWPTLEDIIMTMFFLAMLTGVVIAWFREGIGGTILTTAGLVATALLFLRMTPDDYWVIMIFGVPFLFSGILFLVCWRRSSQKLAA
jgi:hypothetical protein